MTTADIRTNTGTTASNSGAGGGRSPGEVAQDEQAAADRAVEVLVGASGVDELRSLGLYNYGHFTSMLVEHGRVHGLGLHLERLQRDCGELFGVTLDIDGVRVAVRQAVASADSTVTTSPAGPAAVVVRVTVFDPDLDLGRPELATWPRLLVTTRPAAAGAPSPLRVQTCMYVRDLPHVKNVALFASVRLRRLARRAGYDDALFVDPTGAVTEGATWNVLAVLDPASHGSEGPVAVFPDGDVLPGVTARLLEQATAAQGMPVRTGRLTVDELTRARAVWALNSVVGLRPIVAVDGQPVPEDPDLTARLRAAYRDLPTEQI